MKGIVFNLLNKLVEEQFGFETWERLLMEVRPESEGVYTAAATYSDEELFALATHLAAMLDIPLNTLVFQFGEYLFGQFVELYPMLIEKATDAKSLLQGVHCIIHMEVRKLHPDAGLPTLSYEDPASDQLVIHYQSERKLCHLAEGLIQGVANHYNTRIDVQHPKCMHRGDPSCRLELQFVPAAQLQAV